MIEVTDSCFCMFHLHTTLNFQKLRRVSRKVFFFHTTFNRSVFEPHIYLESFAYNSDSKSFELDPKYFWFPCFNISTAFS